MKQGSAQEEDSRRGVPKMEKKSSEHYGMFLGGGNVPPRPERSKTVGDRALGDQGNTIGSQDSASKPVPGAQPIGSGAAFARDRSVGFPPNR